MAIVRRVDIGKYIARFHGRLGSFKRGVLIKLFASVIKDTPVDTGRLRANWMFGVGSAPGGTSASNADPTATVTDRVRGLVDEKDGKYYLANNLDYANRIEYEGWSHTKAPEGMVRKNLVRIANILREQANP